MALISITPMRVSKTSGTALAGGTIDTTDGAKIVGGAYRDIIVYVNNTGVAGTISILPGTAIDDAPSLGAGTASIPVSGTATSFFKVESARHSRGGDIYITFSASMAGNIYAIETQERSVS